MLRVALVSVGLVALWTLLVVGASLAGATWLARPVAPRGDAAALEAHLVGALSAAASTRLGSAALVLLQGGEVFAEHAFGIAHDGSQAPPSLDDTLYQMASVSKVVSAWGVLALVEKGVLGLDEPISRYLTRWRLPGGDGGVAVTVRQLLSHTAGLGDGLGYRGFTPGETLQTLEASLDNALDPAAGEPRGAEVAAEPGRRWRYSGAGYTVLQLLIEEVSGLPFADYLAQEVLQPLGMHDSSFSWEAIVADGRAERLATSFDVDLEPTPHRRYTATAAASLYATPHDVARFALAHLGDNPVLSPASRQAMLEPQPGASLLGRPIWGLGHTLYAADGAGGFIVGHDGNNVPALNHTLRLNPATGNGIVLLVSGNPRLASRLGDDWLIWEVGGGSLPALRRVLSNRFVPTVVLFAMGVVAIVSRAFQKRREGRR